MSVKPQIVGSDIGVESAALKLEIHYDKKADSVYLYFLDRRFAYSKKLDAERTVDYTEEGEIRGIEFLSASSGVKTDDLPHRSAIERALSDKGMAELVRRHGADHSASGFHNNTNDSGEAFSKAEMKARIKTLIWAIVAILAFIGLAAADVMLARNLFVLSSLPGLVASLIGLVFALFPTVLGCFILLAWALDTLSEASYL